MYASSWVLKFRESEATVRAKHGLFLTLKAENFSMILMLWSCDVASDDGGKKPKISRMEIGVRQVGKLRLT